MADYKGTGTYYDYNISDDDKKKIDSYKAQYAAAEAAGDAEGMANAHSGAEEIRKQYAYSGGNDGSEYHALADTQPTKADNYVAPTLQAATSKEDYVNSIYDQQIKSNEDALKAAYDQNVITLDAAASKIPEQYQSARNKSNSAYEINRANFNEYASTSGINTGAGSQAQLAMGNQQQSDQSAINKAEAQALADIETQRAQIKTQYQNDIASAINQGNLQRAQALYEEAIRVDNSLVQTATAQAQLDMNAASINDTRQNNLYSKNYQAQQDDYNSKLTKAQTMAQMGDFSGYLALGYSQDEVNAMQKEWQFNRDYTVNSEKAQTLAQYGDFSGYKALGYTDEQIAAMESAYALATAPSYSGGSSSGGGGGGTTSMTLTRAKEYAAQGLFDEPGVLETLLGTYSENYLKTAYPQYSAWLNKQGTQLTNNESYTIDLNQPYYQEIMKNAQTMGGRHGTTGIAAYLADCVAQGAITEAERLAIIRAMGA